MVCCAPVVLTWSVKVPLNPYSLAPLGSFKLAPTVMLAANPLAEISMPPMAGAENNWLPPTSMTMVALALTARPPEPTTR